jgi:hypothetical protein
VDLAKTKLKQGSQKVENGTSPKIFKSQFCNYLIEVNSFSMLQFHNIYKTKRDSMAKCKFCNDDINWIKEGRKNQPINGDGTVHKCEQMINSMKSIKKLDRSSISNEDIARYEKQINEKK